MQFSAGTVAREWEVALSHELGPEGRRELVAAFASALVERYGVAVDAAIHAPHREGDQRNWHAHVMATTRERAKERKVGPGDVRDRLRAILGRQEEQKAERGPERGLERSLERAAMSQRERERAPEDERSVTERLRAALDRARSAPPGRELRTKAEEWAVERERQREMERERWPGHGLDDGLEL